jgi:CDP-glucose 4,6-dehydratase
MGTVNILEAVRQSNTVVSFVNVTTDKVYKNKEWNWGYRENEDLCGLDPYSNSKSCSELVTYSYNHSFFNDLTSPTISTVRSGNVIGGGDYSEDRILPDCIRFVLSGKDIIIRNPCSTRPYQHVLDSLFGYMLVAEKQCEDRKYIGNYNFGPTEEGCVTTGHLVELFCKIWGEGARWAIDNNKEHPHEDNYLKLDCSKARTILGWNPKWDIQTAVKKTVEYAKKTNDKDRLECIQQQIKEYLSPV